jgi:hypothetical protein
MPVFNDIEEALRCVSAIHLEETDIMVDVVLDLTEFAVEEPEEDEEEGPPTKPCPILFWDGVNNPIFQKDFEVESLFQFAILGDL